MLKLIACLLLLNIAACAKDNKTDESSAMDDLTQRDKLYCDLGEQMFLDEGMAFEKCDAALFTSLHALQCSYANPAVFEYQNTGKLCRRPGCTCWDNRVEGGYTSDSGFSKDMATGMQVYYSKYPNAKFAARVQEYGISKNWTVCDAEDAATLLSKCVMSPKIVYRWAEIERADTGQALTPPEGSPDRHSPNLRGFSGSDEQSRQLAPKIDFTAHLDVLGIITEANLYGGISDASLQTIKDQAEREPNNLLYQAMLARFVTGTKDEVAKKLLKKFPADRLPTSSDWCTSYLYQRDETRGGEPNPDWLPCDRGETHPGTDYLLTSWVLQHLGG